MIFGASVYYLLGTFIVLGLAWRKGGVTFECAVALVVWFCLANFAYEKGEVETGATILAGSLQLGICGFLVWKHNHHWLALWLLVSAASVILWAAFYSGDPYTFKAVKNGIYIGELLAVSVSIWTSNQTRSE